MKKYIPAITALIGTLLIAAFLVWAFSLHGTTGLYRVNGQFHSLFLYLGGFGLVLLLLSLLFIWLKARGTGRLIWLVILLFVLAVPGIIVPPFAFAYTNGVFSGRVGDTPPQLLIMDGAGAKGVPDMAVAFNTAAAKRETLTWGLPGALKTLVEQEDSREHVFVLKDLKPATVYTYSINDGEKYSFTTPALNNALHFAFGSDAHYGAGDNEPDLTAKMLKQIADPANSFNMFFYGGDLVEYGFSPNQWGEAFRAFADASSTIPMRYVIGNHESLFTGSSLSKKLLYPPLMELQTGSPLWYRIDIGNMHFLCLDIEWSAESYTRAQADWLEAQLSAIPAGDWKIVVNHGFYYSSGSLVDGWKWYDNRETIDPITPLFEKYHVNLVLSGHNHQMEWLQFHGVSYAICGAFGGEPDGMRTYTSPQSIWYKNGATGFLDITIENNNAAVIFRSPEGDEINSFSIEKQ
jgi:acid phosphatase type 7